MGTCNCPLVDASTPGDVEMCLTCGQWWLGDGTDIAPITPVEAADIAREPIVAGDRWADIDATIEILDAAGARMDEQRI